MAQSMNFRIIAPNVAWWFTYEPEEERLQSEVDRILMGGGTILDLEKIP